MPAGGGGGPYDPAWEGPGGTVPGAFDDGFYEVVDAPISRSDGDRYFRNLGYPGSGDCNAGWPEMNDPSINTYVHQYTPYPYSPQHPKHSGQHPGSDGIAGKNAVIDEDLNGVPEAHGEEPIVGWAVVGVTCDSSLNRHHAVVGVGDINRLIASYLPPPAPQGAEWWAGAVSGTPAPPGIDPDKVIDKVFCATYECSAAQVKTSIHELGHVIGLLGDNTEECPGDDIPHPDKSVMTYDCTKKREGSTMYFSIGQINDGREGRWRQ